MKYYQKMMCSEQVAVEWGHPGQPVLLYLLWPEVLTHQPERGLCPVATAYHCFPADAQDFHCSSAPDMRCSFRILRGHLTQEGTALAEGIGEKLTPLAPAPDCYVLVAKPDINVSTKYVYEHLDAQEIRKHPDIDGMVEAIAEESLQGILDRMENVLETVTVSAYPIIQKIKDRMKELGAINSLMSGSGPTVFGIFVEKDMARRAYDKLEEEQLAKQIFLTEFCE